ncbi:interleukin-1 receptor type 2 [Protobothrops mucrosquamatus]|uniref:interleukin-1 receptor type 2 n=1 Tax=Protobothrops mucrosquamatus TaxID=103944 RepID=UPI0007756B30|nr:interleukin-1 receptor type 2 [Protobothrops mucrosquamatus]
MPPSGPDARPLAGCLLLVLLSVSPSIQAPAAEKAEKGSRIISSLRFRPYLGQKIRVCCQGVTAYTESGIMYWLANGSFVDQLYPNGSVKEEPTVEKGSQLTRCLIFSPLRAQDLHASFECVITDPSGVFRKAIRWDYPDNEKEWKPSSPRLVRRAQGEEHQPSTLQG